VAGFGTTKLLTLVAPPVLRLAIHRGSTPPTLGIWATKNYLFCSLRLGVIPWLHQLL